MLRIATTILALSFVLFTAFGVRASDNLTPRALSDVMRNAIAAVVEDGKPKEAFCTAAKVGDRQYLTAAHCVQPSMNIRTSSGQVLKTQSVLLSLSKEGDWAVVNTTTEDTSTKALVLDCDADIYLGQPVAFMGFPYPLNYTFGLGSVYSTDKTQIKDVDGQPQVSADFIIDLSAAPGASGSPIVDANSGRVLGVLTTAFLSRFGAFAVGVESLRSIDLCPSAAEMKSSEDARTK